MKYSLVGAAIIAGTVLTVAAPVNDNGLLGPRSEEQGSLLRREANAYYGGQGELNPVPFFSGAIAVFAYVAGIFV